MIRILRADFRRLQKDRALWLSVLGMLLISAGFMFIQASAMDYTVPLSRVIFLPLSMLGIALGAFAAMFSGTDFSDGVIRNKLLTAENRGSLVLSEMIVSAAGCLLIYALVTAFSAGGGRFFFENNVDLVVFARYFALGASMSLAYGCLFSALTMICGKKTQSVILCMGLAFLMLFAALSSNEVLVQTEYRNGVLNPHFVGGMRREIYSFLHDLNPCGQAAQLSAWEVRHPVRILLLNLIVILGSSMLACLFFQKKDIR